MIPTDKRNEYYENYLHDLTEHFDHPDAQTSPIHVGEKIRHLRQQQGMSLEDLAAKTNFDLELLRQIEQETITPPLGTMIHLSRALNTVMSSIISGEIDRQHYSVQRVKDQRTAPLPSGKTSDHSYIPLGADLAGRHMDAFIVKLNPVQSRSLAPAVHEGEEFIYVLDGEVKATIAGQEEILGIGDALYLKSTASHVVTTNTDRPAIILAVLYSDS